MIHATPAELARHSDIVITMVSDSPDVEAVCFGEQGVSAGAKPGLCVIDMSTIAPDAARNIGRQLAAVEVGFWMPLFLVARSVP